VNTASTSAPSANRATVFPVCPLFQGQTLLAHEGVVDPVATHITHLRFGFNLGICIHSCPIFTPFTTLSKLARWPLRLVLCEKSISYQNWHSSRADLYYLKKVCPIKISVAAALISLFE
jgi:hypothetical protein